MLPSHRKCVITEPVTPVILLIKSDSCRPGTAHKSCRFGDARYTDSNPYTHFPAYLCIHLFIYLGTSHDRSHIEHNHVDLFLYQSLYQSI